MLYHIDGSVPYFAAGTQQWRVDGVIAAGETGPFTNVNYATRWRTWTYNFVHALDTHWP